MAKKKATRRSTTAVSPSTSKSVQLEKISNGYVVSTYNNIGNKKAVFTKNLAAAKKQVARML